MKKIDLEHLVTEASLEEYNVVIYRSRNDEGPIARYTVALIPKDDIDFDNMNNICDGDSVDDALANLYEDYIVGKA